MEFLHTLLTYLTTNAVAIGAVVGAVTPVIVSLVSRPTFSARTRTLISVAAAAVIGTVLTLSNSHIEGPGDFVAVLLSIYASCETFYQRFYKATGLAQVIEAATTPKPKDDGPGLDELEAA